MCILNSFQSRFSLASNGDIPAGENNSAKLTPTQDRADSGSENNRLPEPFLDIFGVCLARR